MIIAEVLSGRAGAAGVRAALTEPPTQAALRELLTGLLEPGSALGTCQVYRAKYKPGRHLTAYYKLSLQPQESVQQIEVSWRPAGAADPRGAPQALLDMQAEARAAGLVAPFQALLADDPSWGLFVQVAPLDVEFPQLVRMSDPQQVRALLGGVEVQVDAVRYRPGQRHVLRYGAARPEETRFAKVYNSDKGQRSFKLAGAIADLLAEQGNYISAVRPTAYLRAENSVLYPFVAGTPLSQLLAQPGQQAGALLKQAGAALAALHRIPTNAVELHDHSFAKELKSIASAAEHIHTLLPATGATIRALLERAQQLDARLPQPAPAFAYGDFKADHLWATPAGLTLIDMDTCYLADPAIDLGKFLADIHWWFDGYGHSGVPEAQQQFLAGYDARLDSARLLRARLYEVLVLTKTTARRVTLFAPDWAERTTRLIATAERLLGALERQVA